MTSPYLERPLRSYADVLAQRTHFKRVRRNLAPLDYALASVSRLAPSAGPTDTSLALLPQGEAGEAGKTQSEAEVLKILAKLARSF